MNSPKGDITLTVLMPVYNAEPYVAESIRSMLDQTMGEFELLVINDGSTDASMDIVRSFEDPRIRIVENEKNMGLIATLNRGLAMIRTEYVARMDADDVSLPERLRLQLEFMQANPDVGACGTWYDNILEDGTERRGGRYLPTHDQILFRNLYQLHIIHGTTMMRMNCIRTNNLRFDPSFLHAEDYDFFVRMSERSKLHNIQHVLYKIRHHSSSVSKKFASVQHANSNRVKKRIFHAMGVEPTDEELDLYREFMHQDYGKFIGPQRNRLLRFISNIIEANQRTGYLPAEYLRKELSVRVLHLFNQIAGKEKGILTELRNFAYIRAADDPKLYLSTYGKVLLR